MTDQPPRWSSIDEIAADVIVCPLCALSETRTHAVPGDGSPNAAVMFIGEGPGQREDEQGLPFVGRAGRLLDSLLSEVPLSREDVFITNIVKCRPPGNRDPQPEETAACRPYLEAQIELINPRVIVTLGRHSLLHFYPQGKISNDHGRIIRMDERVLLPLYHPAAALRNPQLNETMREDIKRIPEAVRESLLLQAKPGPDSDGPAVTERDVERELYEPRNSGSGGAASGPAGSQAGRDDHDQMSLF